MARANVNSSQDYSLGEITVIMLCCTDEEVFFSEKSPLSDLIRHQLVNLTPANYAAMLSITFNNIGPLSETFKFHFAKKLDFKTGGLEYH